MSLRLGDVTGFRRRGVNAAIRHAGIHMQTLSNMERMINKTMGINIEYQQRCNQLEYYCAVLRVCVYCVYLMLV